MSIKPGYRKPTKLLTKYERNKRFDMYIKRAVWLGILIVIFLLIKGAYNEINL